jgi:hypothetical protein
MVPRIRAALKVGKPPLMFIFEDPKHEWGKWDFRLAKAMEIREDMLQGGVPIYWDRSERMTFDVGSYVSKSKAALDRAEEKASKGKAKNYGKVFYPIPIVTDGGALPTLEEWLEEQRAKKGAESNFDPNLGGGGLSAGGGEFSNAHWQPEQAPELD